MERWVDEIPAQVVRALDQATASGWFQEPLRERPRAVFLGGMGGSGMACRIALDLVSDRLSLPALVRGDPEVPAWVSGRDLAGVVSYSGSTWESVEMARLLEERGAPAFVVSSSDEQPPGTSRFTVPKGYAPRAAVPWMLVPVALALGAAAGLSLDHELRDAAAHVEGEIAAWRARNCRPERDPWKIADRLASGQVWIYATSHADLPIAIRWKNQLAENAKRDSAVNTFPELAHAEIMGWKRAIARGPATFVILDGGEVPVDARRRSIDASLAELSRAGGAIIRIPAIGRSRAARVLGQIALGDRVSVEVARRLGVDPLEIDAIDRVKAEFARAGRAERN